MNLPPGSPLLSPSTKDRRRRGLGSATSAERLVVAAGAVHKHVRGIFAKLCLAPADRTDRRVAAVLHCLDDTRRRA